MPKNLPKKRKGAITKKKPKSRKAKTNESSKLDNSADLVCAYCVRPNESREWMVQCDVCDHYVHYSCAGITVIGEEEPWSCEECNKVANLQDNRTDNSDEQDENTNPAIITVEVHRQSTLEDIEEQPEDLENIQQSSRIQSPDNTVTTPRINESKIENVVDQSTSQNEISVDPTNQSASKISSPSQSQSVKSKGSTIRSIRSSTSSNRRREIEMKRAEEERKLQAELDEETLQLNLEAVKLKHEALKLKQLRERKFLDEKYKNLSEKGEGSVISRTSKETKHSFVADWVNDQDQRTTTLKTRSLDENHMRSIHRFSNTIDELSFDVSIPIDDHEVKKIKSTLYVGNLNQPIATNPDNLNGPTVTNMKKPNDISQINQPEKQDKTVHPLGVLKYPRNYIDEQSQQPNVSVAGDSQRASKDQLTTEQKSSTFTNKLQSKGVADRYMDVDQQNKLMSLSHTANAIKMPPRSRSTLLNPRPINEQTNQKITLDVQDPNSHYVFSRSSQPTKLFMTNTGRPIVSTKPNSIKEDRNVDQRYLINNPVVSSHPINSSSANIRYENQREGQYVSTVEPIRPTTPLITSFEFGKQQKLPMHSTYEPVTCQSNSSTATGSKNEYQRNHQTFSTYDPVTCQAKIASMNGSKYNNNSNQQEYLRYDPATSIIPSSANVNYDRTRTMNSTNDPVLINQTTIPAIPSTGYESRSNSQFQSMNYNTNPKPQRRNYEEGPSDNLYYEQIYSTRQSDSPIIRENTVSFSQPTPLNQRTYSHQDIAQSSYPTPSNQHPNRRNNSSNCRNSQNPATMIRNMEEDRFLRVRDPLTTSQIAARHAISKELPKFYGNSKQWPRFITRYFNTTELCGLSNDENIERLDKCLQGDAYTLVKGLLIMPNSIPAILETLYEKWGRPELIIKAILEDVRAYQTIRPDKLEKLSDFGYVVWNACQQIEDMQLLNYLVSPDLIQEIIEKLPYQTKIDWARHSEDIEEVTLRHLAEWLRALSRAINRISTEVSTSSNDQKSSNHGRGERKKEYSKNENSKAGWINLHENNNKLSANIAKQSKCPICSKDCKSVELCTKFKSSDVDERWKLSKGGNLCRKCLKIHARNQCQNSKACGVNGCEYKHHHLLHNDQWPDNSSSNNQTSKARDVKISEINNKNNGKVIVGRNNTHLATSGELFRIVRVQLYAHDKVVTTYAYLDEGSSFTLMERKVADILGLNGTRETICLLWTNNVHRQEESEVVTLEIAGKLSKNDKEPVVRYPFNAVNVIEELNLPEQSLPLDKFKERYEHLRNIPMDGYEKVIPTLLIGIKHAKLAVPLVTVEGEDEGPIATRSRLGWSLYGPGDSTSSGYVNVHRVSKCPCQERDYDVHKMIKDHFSVENFGVVTNSVTLESKENEKALKMLEDLTVRRGNRFETGLLWKNEVYRLPDSYGMARKRLECSENKGPKVVNIINEAVQDYLSKGYVSKLTPAEVSKARQRIWYLPLFTVSHPKKPEKLRSVFDAAARVKNVSLNSVLHTGPDLLVSIVDVLRRFRENKVAFCGDIKEMYHQVFVREEDRHAQRFLWRNGDKTKEPDVYVMNVMTFGATCSPSAAQFVKNLNASEFQDRYPRAAEAIIKNHYVDDLMDGTSTITDAINLINDVKFIHSQGGFEIRNFKCNSMEVLKAIGERTNSDEPVSVENGMDLERVLVMFWDIESDCFTFSLKYTKVSMDVLIGNKLPTKRELLKLLMSIFDPLGLLSYYLIHLKILLQDVWRSEIKWDDLLPINLKLRWVQWIEILKNVEKLKIPRWYLNDMTAIDEEADLHVFVDAGDYAYAAVAYLRFRTSIGYACSLVGSKARVAPLKYLSIPRKELMASLLGARLSNSIQKGLKLKIKRRIFWSDSQTVLSWLHSDHRKYSQFVAHRMGEILETTELVEWKYVPSKQNVADEATKWSKTPTFEARDRWFTGPEFLKEEEEKWPSQPKIIENETKEEMKLSCSHASLIMPSIVNPANFSKWERALRSVATAIRWGRKVLSKVRKSSYSPQGPLTREELITAERLLFRQAQWEGFTEKMIQLAKNEKNPKKAQSIEKGSSIYDCTPYLDEFGIMRVMGRIDKASALTLDAKRPIIMPRNHRITSLIMLSYHVKYIHRNHETVINELKQRFYIPRVRVVFRSIRWNCAFCNIRRSLPRPPLMADLPAVRFEPGVRSFTYTGIDYFGPIKVMVGRHIEKRWGILFTCLTIRAIHIEIAHSLNTESCKINIRNFINLRGRPKEFFSDNGTNFVGTNRELQDELKRVNVKELGEEFTSCYTHWNFNPPASPHMGGIWERLISTVKSCLEDSMTMRTPKDEVLRGLLWEIMNVVNSRPLTHIPLDSEESEALTPNHFILGTSNGLKPPGEFSSNGPYLRAGFNEIQRCTNIFWKRFIHEYIPTLTRRSKWFERVKPVEIGDIVIHFDENSPRNTYIRAKVVETRMGSKDQVRQAKIQMPNGSTLWRPTVKLGVLDLSSEAPTQESLVHQPTIETGGTNVGAINSSKFNQAPTTKDTGPLSSIN